MFKHARNLEFEQAARLRDEIRKLQASRRWDLPDGENRPCASRYPACLARYLTAILCRPFR